MPVPRHRVAGEIGRPEQVVVDHQIDRVCRAFGAAAGCGGAGGWIEDGHRDYAEGGGGPQRGLRAHNPTDDGKAWARGVHHGRPFGALAGEPDTLPYEP